MRIATPEDFAEIRAMIEQRTADRIERSIANAQAFAASPAYARAIREIVDNCERALSLQSSR